MAWRIDYDEQAWMSNTVNADSRHLRVRRGSLSIIPTALQAPALGRRELSVFRCGPLRITVYSDGTTQKVIGE